MVSIQEAVQKAAAFAMETLGRDLTSSLQVEEVESDTVKGEDAWVITLSIPSRSPVAAFTGVREYKRFSVLKGTGEVVWMRIRELASD